jgi:hypothetical protein
MNAQTCRRWTAEAPAAICGCHRITYYGAQQTQCQALDVHAGPRTSTGRSRAPQQPTLAHCRPCLSPQAACPCTRQTCRRARASASADRAQQNAREVSVALIQWMCLPESSHCNACFVGTLLAQLMRPQHQLDKSLQPCCCPGTLPDIGMLS